MKDINKFHRSAMDFADRAFIAKQEGKQRSFITLSRKAFHAEKKAAELCQGQYAIEPTRSILHRSAAALALDCGELREAERLIAMALAGEPPQQIAEELRDLLEQTYFRRHLELKGQELSSAELLPRELRIREVPGHSVFEWTAAAVKVSHKGDDGDDIPF